MYISDLKNALNLILANLKNALNLVVEAKLCLGNPVIGQTLFLTLYFLT